MNRNVLFITVDQWRGDSLSALGHPVLDHPDPRPGGRRGHPVRQPLGQRRPVRAVPGLPLYRHLPPPQPVGQQRDPARCPLHQRGPAGPGGRVRPGAVRLHRHQPGPTDPARRTTPGSAPTRRCCRGFGPWSTSRGRPAASSGDGGWRPRGWTCRPIPTTCTCPIPDWPGADRHGSTWAPARFTPEQSETAFLVEAVTGWLDQHGQDPFFLHASFIRPHPPRRNPVGYHDLYDADDLPPFVAAPTKAEEAATHPLNRILMYLPGMCGTGGRDASAARSGPPTTEPRRRSTTNWAGCSTTSTARVWPRPPWWSSPVTTGRWAGTTGWWRSSATGTSPSTCP